MKANTETGSMQSLNDIKFRLLITICLAHRDDLDYLEDLQLAWNLIDDPMVRCRLEKEGLLAEADSCRQAGQGHWYRLRHDLGKAVRDELLTEWGLTKVNTKDD